MPTIAVVGVQWGDEGKGKIVDALSDQAHLVARYQGGPNAGHTVIVGEEKYIFHHIPSGILREDKICVIGNGVVVDLLTLVKEIDDLEARGVNLQDRFLISDRAHLILPYHKALDVAMEESKQGDKIGTTGRGIGPTYADKVARTGIRMVDFLDEKLFSEKLKTCIEEKNAVFEKIYDSSGFDYREVLEEYLSLRRKVCGFITDTGDLIRKAISRNENVILEGAQGTMLDLDQGSYPYVTSSNSTVGGACAGLGIPPRSVGEVMGVTKAYTTRVGMGPFPTELHDETGDLLRDRGSEYGSTTGRSRRCGWFDAVVARHAIELNGISQLVVTKLDVLDQCESVLVCTSYSLDGKIIDHIPADAAALSRCRPVYQTLSGWESNIEGAKQWDDLPRQAREYLDNLKTILGTKIVMVSVGAGRDHTINTGFQWL